MAKKYALLQQVRLSKLLSAMINTKMLLKDLRPTIFLFRHLFFASLFAMATISVEHAYAQKPDRIPIPPPIIDGTEISAEGTNHIHTSSCSGILITNNWVLTAKHCPNLTAPASQWEGFLGLQQADGRRFVVHPVFDAVLVELEAPLEMNGTTTGFRQQIYAGDKGGLVGKQVDCYGYGRPNFPRQGILRTARFEIVDVPSGLPEDQRRNYKKNYPHYLPIMKNAIGQLPSGGDSGGACIYTTPSGEKLLVGILTSGNNSYCEYTASSALWPWIQATIGNVPKQALRFSHSNMCLDVPHSSTDNDVQLIQYPCYGTSNQKFQLVPFDDNRHFVLISHSGKCLDVSKSSQSNGAKVIQFQCNGTTNQLWHVLDSHSEGIYLRADHSNKCIDLTESSLENEAKVIQYECNWTNNQRLIPY